MPTTERFCIGDGCIPAGCLYTCSIIHVGCLYVCIPVGCLYTCSMCACRMSIYPEAVCIPVGFLCICRMWANGPKCVPDQIGPMGPTGPRPNWATGLRPNWTNGSKWDPGPNYGNLSLVAFLGRITQQNNIDMAICVCVCISGGLHTC